MGGLKLKLNYKIDDIQIIKIPLLKDDTNLRVREKLS